MPETDWQQAATLEDLERTGRKLFRKDGRQIVIFHTAAGLYACNNRCPHEGYPLTEGTLDEEDCVLACNWHNWKFKLATGDNLYGGDRLRTYPVEVRGGTVWIDMADPPFEVRYRQIMRNLREAFDDNAYDRMGRELARLRRLGADPLDAVREAIVWSYDRMEFGWTHAFAGAADWLSLYDENEGDDETQLVCLLEIVGHLADDVLREQTYPFFTGRTDYDEDGLVAAIENEDEERAIALLRGALCSGLRFEDLERGLARAALAHYNDFGHSLIYTVKAGSLIDRLGHDLAQPLLLCLVRSLVYATREDRIPEFRRYPEMLARWGNGDAAAGANGGDYQGLGINKAMERAVGLSAAPVAVQYAALLAANARNMRDFDLYYQEQTTRPVQDNVGWLDFTHGLTFANAVRRICSRHPQLWPGGLLQLACFCGRNTPYTDSGQDPSRWQVDDPDGFIRATIESLYDHGREEFIVSVHLLKTALAVRDELAAGMQPEVKSVVLAALNRFINEPLKRKHARRTARQSINFVAKEG